jgi:purine-nucleoside phosphorylase
MQDYRKAVKESVEYIQKRMDATPEIGLLTGTGLGQSVQSMSQSISLPYQEIPHFPISTVESHSGNLLQGKLGKREILVLQGRFHLYEGYSPLEVTFPIRVMQEMGIDKLIVTNAAGGLNPTYRPGDVMLIQDHINLTGANPLVGPNHDDWGVRFPDMSAAYNEGMLTLAEGACRQMDIDHRRGIYAGLRGPALETPAEVRFLQTIGADAVGFSTIQEVIVAVHGGMKILGLSIVTNVHDPDNPAPADVEDIIETAQKTAPAIDRIIGLVIEKVE